MQYTTAILAFAVSAAALSLDDEIFNRTPDQSNPSDCQSTLDYAFTFITVDAAGASPAKEKRQTADNCTSEGAILLELTNGRLIDDRGRTGSIVANSQYQYDGPPQADAIYTNGWCVIRSNGSLTIGDNSLFYNCKSGGNGAPEFNNIYNRITSKLDPTKCKPVVMDTIRCPEQKPNLEQATINVPVGAPRQSGNGAASSATGSSSSETASTTASASSAEHEDIMTQMMTSIPPNFVTSMPAAATGNATSAATGTAVAPTSNGDSAPAPSPFVGAGAAVQAGQKLVAVVAVVAGAAAFALL